MKDTTEEIENRVTTMMRQKTGAERLIMGCSMYEFSKKLIVSSLRDKNPDISSGALRREIFLRFYGQDFAEPRRQDILNYLMGEK